MIMARQCRLAGVDPEAVWQWAFIERVANDLHMLRVGEHVESEKILTGVGKLTLSGSRARPSFAPVTWPSSRSDSSSTITAATAQPSCPPPRR
jgi:hypothetical protein